ncbi:MAG: metallophosphoesterase family protein, partial [Hymenobacteraceae bacterium]|nr:metallophosphoesterase family protein [Hymenobacteraceae bacterium]
EKSLLRLLEDANADIMLFGHTHKPFHRALPYQHNGQTRYRHAINLGSVGKPKDGDNRGCYALLTLDENENPAEQEQLQLEFVRFNYDIEKAAKAIEESPLPNEFADMLRKGY